MRVKNILIGIILVSIPWVTSGYEVNGTITNGTTEQPLTNYPVALKSFQNQKEQVIAVDTTDNAGEFTFSDLQENGKYGVYLAYQMIKYDEIRWEKPLPADHPINITVFDTTRSDSQVEIAMQHTVLTEGEGKLLVQQIMRIHNTGEKAFIGTVPVSQNAYRTLSFRLPEGARNIQPGKGFMQCCVGIDQNGFYDTMELLPGRKDVVLLYELPVQTEEFEFREHVSYPIQSYVALIKRKKADVSSSKLDLLETATDDSFVQLAANKIRQGSVIPITFENFLQPPRDYGAYFIGLFLVILTGGLFLAQHGKSKHNKSTGEKNMKFDPVCRMPVPEEDHTYTTVYQGETYYFCCEGCQKKFEKQPEEYIEQSE